MEPGFGAEDYGCQSVLGPAQPAAPLTQGLPPLPGQILSGESIEVAGNVSGEVTWAADVVRVVGEVVVLPESSLTIAPGARVVFAGFHRILVRGRLWAVGEHDRHIVFTTDSGQDAEGWDGIDFHNIPADRDWSRLEHCVVEGAVARASSAGANSRLVGGTMRPETGGALSFVNVNKVAVASCTVRHNRADYGAAVYVGYGASPVLAGNVFHDNTAGNNGSVLFSVYAYPKLLYNTIAGNTCLPESAFYVCGAVENFNGKILLLGNVIRDNATNHYSGQQVIEPKDFYTLHNNLEAFAGNPSNLDLPVLWAGQGAHPYQMTAGSPGIDGGVDHLLALQLADQDPAGHDRLCGLNLDLGAYEYCGVVSGVEELPSSAPAVDLRCWPNPFNPRITARFVLERADRVVLSVYSLQGRRICLVHEGVLPAGEHGLVWSGRDDRGRDVASGTYFLRLVTGEGVASRPVVLLR